MESLHHKLKSRHEPYKEKWVMFTNGTPAMGGGAQPLAPHTGAVSRKQSSFDGKIWQSAVFVLCAYPLNIKVINNNFSHTIIIILK